MMSRNYIKMLNIVTQRCDKTLSVKCALSMQIYRNCSVFSNVHWNIHRGFNKMCWRLYSESRNTSLMSDFDENKFVQKERRIGITRGEQRALLKKKPKPLPDQRILKVAIIGAPNAGKSTLANQLIGWKFSAVSSKVHTTRYKSLGVLTENNTQIIFLDTPGIITPMQRRKYDMENSLLRDPHSSLYDADLILAMVDASHVWDRNHLDVELQKALQFHRNKKSVLVLNKIDVFPREGELLHTARILSEGQISGKKDWYRPIQRDANRNKISLKQLFNKVDSSQTKSLASVSDSCADKNDQEEVDVPAESVVMDSNCDPIRSTVTKGDGEPITSVVTNHNVSEPVISAVRSEPESDDSDSDDVIPRNVSNLDNQEVWHKYYTQEIRRIGDKLQNKVGFGGFDRVFYISALEGTLVDELRTYLLNEAYPGSWEYDEDVVTDQDPVLLAKMSVWERILDHLPKEIPYTVDLRKTVWAVDSDGLLHVEFELLVKKRYMYNVLSENGRVIQRIAAEAKQELMNTFRREMTLKLVVKPASEKRRKRGF